MLYCVSDRSHYFNDLFVESEVTYSAQKRFNLRFKLEVEVFD
jgi:hypothetical protein